MGGTSGAERAPQAKACGSVGAVGFSPRATLEGVGACKKPLYYKGLMISSESFLGLLTKVETGYA